MWPDSLAVLGLGALGWSVAWQAPQADVARVIGYSANTAEVSQALRAGAISDRAERVGRSCRGVAMAVLTGGLAAITRALAELQRLLIHGDGAGVLALLEFAAGPPGREAR